MDKRQGATAELGSFLFACIVMIPVLVCGCSGFQARSTFKEADDLFSRGNYEASLSAYERIIERFPHAGDRALFEMGIVYTHPGNERKDYRKALECFQELVARYPQSMYRHDSERMIFQIGNAAARDAKIAEQKALIENLRQEVKDRGDEIASLRKTIEALERKMFIIEKGPADKVLIEKEKRRLTLFSKGKALKAYRIALGGNPNGQKEREGDNKTPEGTYVIDSRNRDSRYHLSLHISYPNEMDRTRARELCVSPGGDIMIHGIGKEFPMVGGLHARFDWTRGCIAVTDEEIEEIERLVPNGTLVEIRP